MYGYGIETKVQTSQWKCPEEPRSKKASQVRSNVKGLVTVFFAINVVVNFLPQGSTVNKKYFLEGMRRLRKAIRQKRTELWIKFCPHG